MFPTVSLLPVPHSQSLEEEWIETWKHQLVLEPGVPVFVFLVLQNCKKSLVCIFSAFFLKQILDSWPGAHTKNLHILLGKKKLLETKIPHGFTSPLLGILAFLACAVLAALSQLEGKVSLYTHLSSSYEEALSASI